MQFEWDKHKAKSNLKKHKISFDEAATVFFDSLSATFNDYDHSFEERRFITAGYSYDNRLVIVSHADKGNKIRIISARLATKNERKRHENKN